MDENDSYLSVLRAQGHRITPQRMAILRVLKSARGHLSPAEIYEKVAPELPGMTEATVYRTLNFLAEQGLVLVAHVGHGQLVYEIADHDHHHLICRACGRTQEVDHEALKTLYMNFLEKTGFRIDTIHTTFFGLCPDCQKSSTS